jgi:hypothetical protein
MLRQFAASCATACTIVIFGAHSSPAQSPPDPQRDLPIWSDRDLSLRVGRFASDPEVETLLRLPDVNFSSGPWNERPDQVLVCEPGQFGAQEQPPAAYAQARKPREREPR